VKFLLAKSVVQAPVHFGATADKLEERLEKRIHPRSAFMTGLVRVMGNVACSLFGLFLPRILFPMNGSHLIGQANSLASRAWPLAPGLVCGVELGSIARPWEIQ